MEKTIIDYNQEEGVIIECTQIKPSEHKAARQEAEKLGFSFETIDADSFRAYCSKENLGVLEKLEAAGYEF